MKGNFQVITIIQYEWENKSIVVKGKKKTNLRNPKKDIGKREKRVKHIKKLVKKAVCKF